MEVITDVEHTTPSDKVHDEQSRKPKGSVIPAIACGIGALFLIVSVGIYWFNTNQEKAQDANTSTSVTDDSDEMNQVTKDPLEDVTPVPVQVEEDDQEDVDTQPNSQEFAGDIFAAIQGEIPQGWNYDYELVNNGTAEVFNFVQGDSELNISVSLPYAAPDQVTVPCYTDFTPVTDTIARVRFRESFNGKSHYRYYDGYQSVLSFEGDNEFESAIFSGGITEPELRDIEACGSTIIPFTTQAPVTQDDIDAGIFNNTAWATIDFFGESQEALQDADKLVQDLKY